jgi:hypothetical protein
MLQTIEAEVDVNGNVRLLGTLKVTKTTRAILTLLDDDSSPRLTPPVITAPEERARVIDEIVRSMQTNPLPAQAPRFTREELHERR